MRLLSTNRAGSFALFGDSPSSRYSGVFFWLGGRMFRTISFIDLKENFSSQSYDGFCGVRKRGKLEESFCFANDKNVFFYGLSSPSKFDIVLDCKENYDNREWGRFYDIREEDGLVIVKFSKQDDAHELPGVKFDLFLVFAGVDSFVKIDEWEVEKYPDDESRSSPPFERWVYRLGSMTSGSIAVSCSHDRDEAIKLAKSSLKKKSELLLKARTIGRLLKHILTLAILELA